VTPETPSVKSIHPNLDPEKTTAKFVQQQNITKSDCSKAVSNHPALNLTDSYLYPKYTTWGQLAEDN
jgi:hypothetical protein